ncbi:FAD-dependent oxidoreductase [Pseudonocardia benzenivorans]
MLVVGAGLGGLRTVEALRANGYDGRISLVGDEPHLPYDRPPLSKQLLAGSWEPDRVRLRAEDTYDDLGVRTYLGTRAVGWRPGQVVLDDGATMYADAIVVATGLSARRLPGQPDSVFTLRTWTTRWPCALPWTRRRRWRSWVPGSWARRWPAPRATGASR